MDEFAHEVVAECQQTTVARLTVVDVHLSVVEVNLAMVVFGLALARSSPTCGHVGEGYGDGEDENDDVVEEEED